MSSGGKVHFVFSTQTLQCKVQYKADFTEEDDAPKPAVICRNIRFNTFTSSGQTLKFLTFQCLSLHDKHCELFEM